MSVFQVLKIGRKLHPNTVLIIDDYDKYYVYDKDCYVIYQVMNFDIKGKKDLFLWNKIEYLSYLVKKLKEQKLIIKFYVKDMVMKLLMRVVFLIINIVDF